MNRKTKARAWKKKQYGKFGFKVKMSDEFIRINATQSLIAFLTILKTFNQATKEQLIQLEKLQDERDELIKNLCKNS